MPPALPVPRRLPVKHVPIVATTDAPDERLLKVELGGGVSVGYDGILTTSGAGDAPPAFPFDQLKFVRSLGKGREGAVELFAVARDHPDQAQHFSARADVRGLYAVKRLPSRNPTASKLAQVRQAFLPPCPSVVRTFNAVARDGDILLITEYADGGDLRRALKSWRHHHDQGAAGSSRLDEAAAAHVARQCLLGLLHCHAHLDGSVAAADEPALSSSSNSSMPSPTNSSGKLVHRDVKPGNILLTTGGHVKLCDFGTAGIARHSLDLASACGTTTYMSPERIKGQPYGAASDVWSLGIIVAEMLRGRHPLRSAVGGSVLEVVREICDMRRVKVGSLRSDEAQDFVDCCLRANSSERPKAAALLAHAWLQRFDEAQGRAAVAALVASTAMLPTADSVV